MKKYFGAAIAFALAATLMTGCGCTNQNDGMITDPTTVSTTAATMPSSDTTPIATTDPVVTTESEMTTDTTVDTTAETHVTDATNEGTIDETTGEGMVGRARRAIDRAIK